MTCDDLAQQLLRETREKLSTADNKASLILTATSVVVATVASLNSPVDPNRG